MGASVSLQNFVAVIPYRSNITLETISIKQGSLNSIGIMESLSGGGQVVAFNNQRQTGDGWYHRQSCHINNQNTLTHIGLSHWTVDYRVSKNK